ncbi:tetraacyldisaccharide 4'-kinase [Massilia sp. YIM B02763]|uniref:tetraacyldisaccharide 4'-kinase n=1 Tax=Massilia sp. YIM B02763 TaxID=3050130 RepID=UPI0025B72AC4|nr:tetraacyldisaccharide 4'-kinase [Massilia sp. YIM B02763]MDN4052473.1 tetraacyldisaccharide 4'-kinase [Massilia sp. YIM B02763]
MSSSLESTLTRAWLARGPLALALWPVSLPFRLLAALRRGCFRIGLLKSERLPVPVVVVGNIFIGGTGKTPLTIWLARQLRAAGLRPGVISRGHGGAEEAPREVLSSSSARDVGDEPLLIAARAGCPVVVGRRRVQAGRHLLALHPSVDVLIADDGLQHYALQRDVEIILFDGRGVGNGFTLPAGPLREPPSRRRDVTVVNAPELTPALAQAVGGSPWQMRLAGDVAERLMDGGERLPLAAFAGRRILAAAGIGNPGRFFAMLRGAGLDVMEMPLPDHHDFRDDPFQGVEADVILVTEKDAVKCRQLENINGDPRVWVVPVSAQIDPALAAIILEKCRGRPTA